MRSAYAEQFLCKYPHLGGDRTDGRSGGEKEDSEGSRRLRLYWTELRNSNCPRRHSKPGPRFNWSVKCNWTSKIYSLVSDRILPHGWHLECSLFGCWLTCSRKLCFQRMWTINQLKAPSWSGPLWRFSCRLVLLFCATAISTISALFYMPFLGKERILCQTEAFKSP